jgi:hypothetical protein
MVLRRSFQACWMCAGWAASMGLGAKWCSAAGLTQRSWLTADGAGATHDLLNWITALNRPVDDTDPANGAHRGDTRRSPHTQTPKPHPLNNQPSTPINATKIVKRRGIRTRVEPDGTYLIDSLVGPTEGDERGPTASDILTGGCELESGGSRRMGPCTLRWTAATSGGSAAPAVS